MNKEAREKIEEYLAIERFLVGQLDSIRILREMLCKRWKNKKRYKYPEIREAVRQEKRPKTYLWQAKKIVAERMGISDSTLDQRYYASVATGEGEEK